LYIRHGLNLFLLTIQEGAQLNRETLDKQNEIAVSQDYVSANLLARRASQFLLKPLLNVLLVAGTFAHSRSGTSFPRAESLPSNEPGVNSAATPEREPLLAAGAFVRSRCLVAIAICL
jgi:hypothetical protein